MHEVAITVLGSVIRRPVALSINRFIVYLVVSFALARKSIRRSVADIGLISACNYNIREFCNHLDETPVATHVYLTPAVIFVYIAMDILSRNQHLNGGCENNTRIYSARKIEDVNANFMKNSLTSKTTLCRKTAPDIPETFR